MIYHNHKMHLCKCRWTHRWANKTHTQYVPIVVFGHYDSKYGIEVLITHHTLCSIRIDWFGIFGYSYFLRLMKCGVCFFIDWLNCLKFLLTPYSLRMYEEDANVWLLYSGACILIRNETENDSQHVSMGSNAR